MTKIYPMLKHISPNNIEHHKILTAFQHQFSSSPTLLVRSPGRVNIIGEHTDYNQGFVLPASINMYAYVAVKKNDTNTINLFSVAYNETHSTDITNLNPPSKSWADYILGVVHQLLIGQYPISGFNILLDANLPIGAGLSSSAAVECATIFALNQLFQLNIEKIDMVKMAQKAEHTYTGVQCGIMDMYASMFGKKDFLIQLDCRTNQHKYIPLNLEGIKIVLFNTNVKHSLASSAYNERRQQCEQGVAWVSEAVPNIKSLRGVSLQMLQDYVLPKSEIIFKRCKYVVEENERLLQACEDLNNGNIHSLGKQMFETHKGLSELYEVSCKELDFLVNEVQHEESVLGARMMGGGFGGCTINLVKESAVEELTKTVSEKYKKYTGLTLTAYMAKIENGTELINLIIS